MPGFFWFRQDVDELDDDATTDLAGRLGDVDAWRFVLALKAWCTRHRPLGDVGALGAPALAQAARFRGDPEAFRAALGASGWIDEEGFLKGWTERQSAIFAKAKRDAATKRTARAAAAARQLGIPGADSQTIKTRGGPARAGRDDPVTVSSDLNSDQKEQQAARAANRPLADVLEDLRREAEAERIRDEFFERASK